jgi:hypothetical protein
MCPYPKSKQQRPRCTNHICLLQARPGFRFEIWEIGAKLQDLFAKVGGSDDSLFFAKYKHLAVNRALILIDSVDSDDSDDSDESDDE